jgi:hypothetical protein
VPEQAIEGVYVLSDEERPLVQKGPAELDRGEVAGEAEARAVFDKYRGENRLCTRSARTIRSDIVLSI